LTDNTQALGIRWHLQTNEFLLAGVCCDLKGAGSTATVAGAASVWRCLAQPLARRALGIPQRREVKVNRTPGLGLRADSRKINVFIINNLPVDHNTEQL